MPGKSGILDFKKNLTKINDLRRRFIIFSIFALFVISGISIILLKYHHNMVKQQESIRQIYKVIVNQSKIFNEIATLGELSTKNGRKKNRALRAELRDKAKELEHSVHEFAYWLYDKKNLSLRKLEDSVSGQFIDSRVQKYLSHVKTLTNPKSTNIEINKSVRYITLNSVDGDTAYIDELLDIVDVQSRKTIKQIDTLGVVIVVLGFGEIFFFWFFLFRPINLTMLEQNKGILNSALKIDKISQSRSDFFANISHEIRTPMTAILGYAELLQSQNRSPSVEEIENVVNVINKNASHLLRLLDDVLDISKMESGKFSLTIEEMNLIQLLNEIQSLMQAKTIEKEIDLIFNIKGKIPQKIYSDSKRLKQILINLVGNAIKFTDRGSVTVTTCYNSDGNKLVEFYIKDTGPGIPEDKLESVFEAFEQANTSHSRTHGGTGLGLVISRNLATRLGGDVSIVETSALGSVFKITVYAGDSEPAQLTDTLELIDQTKSYKDLLLPNSLVDKKILVVDDAVENSRLFEIFLKMAGAQVSIANSGEEALEKIDDGIDIVLLDLQMPRFDGFQTIAKIKERGFSMPVCALTAHATPEDIKKTANAGFSGHIVKPIGEKELVLKVLEHLA